MPCVHHTSKHVEADKNKQEISPDESDIAGISGAVDRKFRVRRKQFQYKLKYSRDAVLLWLSLNPQGLANTH
jgi:hypothetical protein